MSAMMCTWLGHKFEARYSKTAAHDVPKLTGRGRLEDVLEPFRDVTYERDICIRCGHTIERNLRP